MRIYKPRISVSLNKVKNDSFGGGGFLRNLERGGSIDLTPFMGLGGSVHTSKSINEPAGTFSISFPDKMSEEHSDSVYGLVEPMDQIEIRIAHDHQSAELPIIMRGFVSSISRSETIGGDGKPSRKVNVVGQDYGKILQIIQIIYLNNSVIGDNIISGFKMLQKYGVDASANPPIQDFVRDVFTEIVDKFVGNITDTMQIIPQVSAEGRVRGRVINDFEGGSLDSLLRQVSDVSPRFNEMFIRDGEDQVDFILRPTPFRDLDGAQIQGEKPEEITIPRSDILSRNVIRTDSSVANLFWVRALGSPLMTDKMMRLNRQIRPITDENADPAVYGVRQLEAVTNLMPPDSEPYDKLTLEKQGEFEDSGMKWQKLRSDLLRDVSKDSVVFESGTMRLRGNENLQIGKTIMVDGGESEAYLLSVDHEYNMYQSYFTNVSFERGTGFIVRNDRSAPYLEEMSS